MMKTNNVTSRPVALILADKLLENDLQTIFGERETASLMIAGSSVIEHILMELQDAKFQQCIVLAGNNAQELQDLVGDVERWGMTINVMTYSSSKEQCLRDFKSMSQPNGLIIIEADSLRSHCIDEFLAQCDRSDYLLYDALSNDQSLGITLLKPTDSDCIINAMPVMLDNIAVNLLLTSQDFHRANFGVVNGIFSGLEPSVKQNATVGRMQHWAANVHNLSADSLANVMIDKRCRVERNVSMRSVILNHDVLVESEARLERSIVMPNSIVSANHLIKDAIIHNDTIYEVFS